MPFSALSSNCDKAHLYVFYFNDCHNFRESLGAAVKKNCRIFRKFMATSWPAKVTRQETSSSCKLLTVHATTDRIRTDMMPGMTPCQTLLLCTVSLCWLRGVHIFVMIYGTGLDWSLPQHRDSGNYATDLVRGMRGAKLSEVEVEAEAVFCCYSFVISFFFFGQQMLKASDRFFDNLIYGTSRSAWLDEVPLATLPPCLDYKSIFMFRVTFTVTRLWLVC